MLEFLLHFLYKYLLHRRRVDGNARIHFLFSTRRRIFVQLYLTTEKVGMKVVENLHCADSDGKFLPITCRVKHKKHVKKEPGLFKDEFHCNMFILLK